MRPDQMTLPCCEHEPSRLLLQRKAEAPLKADVPQKSMDVGLFGDSHLQADLVDQARKT